MRNVGTPHPHHAGKAQHLSLARLCALLGISVRYLALNCVSHIDGLRGNPLSHLSERPTRTERSKIGIVLQEGGFFEIYYSFK